MVGREIFFDARLSSSGKLSCASCHSAANAYGPPNARAVQLGGRSLRTPVCVLCPRCVIRWRGRRSGRIRGRQAWRNELPNRTMFLQGGFAWDGRFNTLHEQAAFPLLAPSEMASSKERVVQRIEQGPYAEAFRKAFGQDSFASTDKAFDDCADGAGAV